MHCNTNLQKVVKSILMQSFWIHILTLRENYFSLDRNITKTLSSWLLFYTHVVFAILYTCHSSFQENASGFV